MQKPKTLQASDWEHRPLTEAQIRYAATDAAVLLDLFSEINKFDTLAQLVTSMKMPLHTANYVATNSTETDQENGFLPLDVLEPIFVAVFLTKESQRLLLSHIPPIHKVVIADHATISFKPNPNGIQHFPVGVVYQLELVGVCSDENAQAVLVNFLPCISDEYLCSGSKGIDLSTLCSVDVPHITISHTSKVSAQYSNTMLSQSARKTETCQNILLTGTVGVEVQSSSGGLNQVPKKVIKKIEEFIDTGNPGEHLRFKPGELSAMERFAIHRFAEENGLESASTGKEGARQLTLTKPKFIRESGVSHESGLRIVSDVTELDDDIHANLKKATKQSPASYSDTTFTIISHEDFVKARFVNSVVEAPTSMSPHGIVEPNAICWLQTILEPPQQCFRDLITRNTIDVPLAIIIRGLPGCGKSELSKFIAQKVEQAVICSADKYFAQGGLSKRKFKKANMTTEEFYKETFEPALQSQAHESCKAEFLSALNEKRAVVIVDNTNIRLRDYSFYQQQASRVGYEVVVVELLCSGQKDVTLFHSRCKHNVPINEIGRMFSQFEQDVHSLRLVPAGSSYSGTLTHLQIPPGDCCGLNHWLEQNHCFHFNKARPTSHLQMEVIPCSARFIFVPPSLMDQFLINYLADPSPKYICEIATPEMFKLYFDIDYTSQSSLTDTTLFQICSKVDELLHPFYNVKFPQPDLHVLVTGAETERKKSGQKTGIHLKFPFIAVSLDIAMEIRESLVTYMNEISDNAVPCGGWDKTIDKSVYSESNPLGRGLRMLGSHKAHKGVDVGRVYSLLGVVTKMNGVVQWNEQAKQEYNANPVLLLQRSSIRC